MTQLGGANNDGCVFSINTNGSSYRDLFDFKRPDGWSPYGSLALSAGVLYGMTYIGGVSHLGNIFSIDTNGNNEAILYSFTYLNGEYPDGTLILSGGLLYGMIAAGGAFGPGCMFSINTNGSNYTHLMDFNGTDGGSPTGDLILSGRKLYGMTPEGGTHDSGVIFSINTDGSGYKILFDFNNTNGKIPYGDLLLLGKTLFGMTFKGGAHDTGVIFSIDTNGAGYKDIHDFNGINGGLPQGSLIFAGNKLYGMTDVGGAYQAGLIFSIDTTGSSYDDLHDFNDTDGLDPNGDLTISGNTLYGMTYYGGKYNDGVIFSFKDTSICNATRKPAIISYKTTICSGQSTTLKGMGVGSYTWSTGATTDSITIAPSVTTTYTLYTNNGGCSSDTTITINVMPLPSIQLFNNGKICIGKSDTITVSGGSTYSWNNGETSSTIIVSPIKSKEYSVTVKDGNCVLTDSVLVTVKPLPTVIFSGDTSICKGSNGFINVSGGDSYLWNNGATTSSITISQSVPTTYSVQVTKAGCITDTSVSILIAPLPNGSVASPKPVCPGSTVILVASGGTIYSWNNGETTSSISVSPLNTTTYTVNISNGECSIKDSTSVIVNLVPIVNICCDSIITTGESVQLISSGGVQYSWSPSTGLSCDTCPNPIATPSQTTTYILTVTSDSGCTAQTIITIDVACGDVFIPNVFAPNETIHNNLLYVRGPCIASMDFLVFDRWGNKIFESHDLNTGWDGTYRGQALNTGTYIWYLKATMQDGTSIERKGNVTLVR